MAYGEEIFFDDLQLRDTVETVSSMVYAGSFIPKTITFSSTLDAAVDIDIYGCSKEKDTIHYKLNNAPIPILAGENTFETLDDYFQCFFIHVTAQAAPTSGGFTSEMLMTDG